MTAIIIPSITQLTIAGVLAFVGLLVVVTYSLSKGKPKPIYIQLSTKHDELVMLMENKEINAANFLRL